jgi:hypothetical protein
LSQITNSDNERTIVDAFLLEHIDTVPHLEALLLMWNSRPTVWLVDQMAKALFLTIERTKEILDSLARRRLIVFDSGAQDYHYQPDPNLDILLFAVDAAYRSELIRISRLVHSKPPVSVREFAKAFRFKKERE